MAWQGLTVREICEQVKDTERNGNRSHADLMGETVQKRLDALASLLGRSGRVMIGQ